LNVFENSESELQQQNISLKIIPQD